jgi:imidazolonepropionase-like amidohydrolase
VTDRGTVEFGKQADLLILDGQPLSTTTQVLAVLVGGRVVVEPKE